MLSHLRPLRKAMSVGLLGCVGTLWLCYHCSHSALCDKDSMFESWLPKIVLEAPRSFAVPSVDC